MASSHGISTDYKLLEKNFYNQWQCMNKEYPHFGATSGISSMVWWFKLVRGTFENSLSEKQFDEKTVNRIASELYSHYHSPKPYIVLDDGLKSLKRFKDQKLKVGAISNFDNRLHDIVNSVKMQSPLNQKQKFLILPCIEVICVT